MASTVRRLTLRAMHSSTIPLAVAAACLLGCTLPRYDPFAVPEEDFFGEVNTIVVAPVAVPMGFEFAESLLTTLDSLVETELAAAGFQTVSSASYDSVWNRILDQIGPLYDPYSGEPYDEKLEIAREQLFIDLVDLYHPDAVLFPEIQIVDAPFSEGVAEWDGVSESLVGFGARMFAAFAAALLAEEDDLPRGSVDALSLLLVIEDMEGAELFMNAGGIQLLEKLNANGSYRDVPEDEVLTDADRNRKAVSVALEPLTSKPD